MQTVLVARDFAPSVALDYLRAALEARAAAVNTYLGFGKPIDITELRVSGDALVCGMSSSAELARVELNAIVYAYTENIPIALYADVWDCVLREWFTPVRTYISLLFVVDEGERMVAEKLFPNARVVVSGNPLWERSRYTAHSRSDARQHLGVDAQRVVLCGMTKNRAVNFDLIQGVQKLAEDGRIVGILCTHPGDTTPRDQYHSILGGSSAVRLVSESTASALPAADVVMNAASGVGIEAVMQGIPVLEYRTDSIEAEVERIYPNGWRLPEKFPNLVQTVSEDTLVVAAEKVFERSSSWSGIVGKPEHLTSVLTMTDEIKKILA